MRARLIVFMNPNFQPDEQTHPDAKVGDSEAYDASEQQFAASLDVQPESNIADATASAEPADSGEYSETLSADSPTSGDEASTWRREVADRVNRYRSKSPREPRYPSLQLKFETWAPMRAPEPPASRQPVALESVALESETHFMNEALPEPVVHAPVRPHFEVASNLISNVIEFPRFTAEPPSHHDKLAEPVMDQLRILEAPEIAPAPPALGGIHIEQVEERPQERRPGFEVPLQSASIVRRIAAAIGDVLIVVTSIALFGYVFLQLSGPSIPFAQWIGVGAALASVFWIAYQYCFLVYTGSTPGLRLAGLRLARFDGTAASRALRRWRVLTSILSAISLGLGYLWCFLDEDQLCWHDRITKTHLAPKNCSAALTGEDK
jgi:uncharacterized RDD family membrane protein YckC